MSIKSRIKSIEKILLARPCEQTLCLVFENERHGTGMAAGTCKGLLAGMETQDCDNCILLQRGKPVMRVIFHMPAPPYSDNFNQNESSEVNEK